MRAAAIGLAAIIGLAACGPAEPSRQPGPSTSPGPTLAGSATPSPTGTLVVGLADRIETLDPHRAAPGSVDSINHAIFETLVNVGPDGSIQPGLGLEWTVVDDLTIDFQLEGGIVFHNGDPFDADAARFSIERVLDPAVGSPFAARLASIREIEILSTWNIRIDLDRPDPGLVPALALVAMVSPGAILREGEEAFSRMPVGTGPFRLESWNGDEIRLAASTLVMPWREVRPLVAEVIFRTIADTDARIDALVTGAVQIIEGLPADRAGQVEAAGARPVPAIARRGIAVWLTANGTGSVAAAPGDQATAIEALAKRDVRYALNLAIDRVAIVDGPLAGLGAPMTGPWVEGDLGYDPGLPAYEYDPAEATRLLTEAGYGEGFAVTLDACRCEPPEVASAVAEQLRAIGLRVTVRQLDEEPFSASWTAGETNPMRIATVGFPADPSPLLDGWIRSDGFLSRYRNEAVDGLIAEQSRTYDRDARVALLRRIGTLTHDDPPAIFVAANGKLYGAVAGLKWEPSRLGYIPVAGVAVGR